MAGGKAKYLEFFHEADTDGSKFLDIGELIAMLRKKGYKGSDSEIKTMFRTMDTSGDEKVSVDEYLYAMGALPPQDHKKAAMRAVFQSFDRDGNGEIDKQELKKVYEEMGKNFSDAELTRMIELMDTDQNGTVSYEEFIAKTFGSSAI